MNIQQINLINPLFKKKKVYFSAALILKAAAFSVLAGVVIVPFLNHHTGVLKSQLTLDAVHLSMARLELDKARSAAAILKKNTVLEAHLRNAETDAASLTKIMAVLTQGDVGNTIGYSGTMQALARQIGSGLWLTGFDITNAGTEVSLRGKALVPDLIPAYLNRLKREPVIRGLQFSALEIRVPEATSGKKDDVIAAAGQPYLEFNLRSAPVRGPLALSIISPARTGSEQ